MSYRHTDPLNFARAAKLLLHLRGQLVDVTGAEMEIFSNVYASAQEHWQLSKATGVHVYREGDGWHADLVFKDLPRGVANIVGTPAPVATRDEAIDSVVNMMSLCAMRDGVQHPRPASGLRWFRFDQHEIPVDPGMLESYTARVSQVDFTGEDVMQQFDELRFEIAGDGPVTRENWAAASYQLRYDACRMCCTAMAFGYSRVAFDPARPYRPDLEAEAPSMR